MAQQGLSAAQVAERVARGQVNNVPSAPTRTIGQIVRANVLTRFNLLLGSLLLAVHGAEHNDPSGQPRHRPLAQLEPALHLGVSGEVVGEGSVPPSTGCPSAASSCLPSARL